MLIRCQGILSGIKMKRINVDDMRIMFYELMSVRDEDIQPCHMSLQSKSIKIIQDPFDSIRDGKGFYGSLIRAFGDLNDLFLPL